jgi:hypothetical protein
VGVHGGEFVEGIIEQNDHAVGKADCKKGFGFDRAEG